MSTPTKVLWLHDYISIGGVGVGVVIIKENGCGPCLRFRPAVTAEKYRKHQ
jgi:hypothetical protein